MPHTTTNSQEAESASPCNANPPGDPGVCARCAKLTPTCCFVPLGQEEYCFPLSQKERERIEAELEASAEKPFSPSPNTEGFLKVLTSLFPKDAKIIQDLFPLSKSHLRLAVNPSGRCVLLGEAGCLLSRGARPWFCKLFPFWIMRKKIITFNSPSCLATKSALELENLFALLNTNENELKNIYSNLRHDWGLPSL